MDVQNNILNKAARAFLDALHQKFNPRRLELLAARKNIQKKIDGGWDPGFLAETASIREDLSWRAASIPNDLKERWVEITGPVERKMMINALNSGADVFMADFEDSLSPTWKNVIEGQTNLMDAVRKTLSFNSQEGKEYRLNDKIATLLVRPRGWHLEEKGYLVGNEAISASLFDFGLYFFHNAKELLKRGSGPYFYLPKLENHQEAALWNEVFAFSEEYLTIPKQSIKATVLIETILAAFEMEEILFSLKSYCVGLNAGRWDYIFSIIKKFNARDSFILPDRSEITMNVPFMKAYSDLLLQTCHKRGAYAMGGMSAFVPSRKDPEINARAMNQVKQDKLREVHAGFDGTWVAHPDLVSLAKEVFSSQSQTENETRQISADALLDFNLPGTITEKGLLQNISVALLYLESWLKGVGAVTLYNLMEDAATAEISRAQLWQWVHHGAHLDDKRPITLEFVKSLLQAEYDKNPHFLKVPYVILKKLIEHKSFIDFLTLEAYPYLSYENKI